MKKKFLSVLLTLALALTLLPTAAFAIGDDADEWLTLEIASEPDTSGKYEVTVKSGDTKHESTSLMYAITQDDPSETIGEWEAGETPVPSDMGFETAVPEFSEENNGWYLVVIDVQDKVADPDEDPPTQVIAAAGYAQIVVKPTVVITNDVFGFEGPEDREAIFKIDNYNANYMYTVYEGEEGTEKPTEPEAEVNQDGTITLTYADEHEPTDGSFNVVATFGDQTSEAKVIKVVSYDENPDTLTLKITSIKLDENGGDASIEWTVTAGKTNISDYKTWENFWDLFKKVNVQFNDDALTTVPFKEDDTDGGHSLNDRTIVFDGTLTGLKAFPEGATSASIKAELWEDLVSAYTLVPETYKITTTTGSTVDSEEVKEAVDELLNELLNDSAKKEEFQKANTEGVQNTIKELLAAGGAADRDKENVDLKKELTENEAVAGEILRLMKDENGRNLKYKYTGKVTEESGSVLSDAARVLIGMYAESGDEIDIDEGAVEVPDVKPEGVNIAKSSAYSIEIKFNGVSQDEFELGFPITLSYGDFNADNLHVYHYLGGNSAQPTPIPDSAVEVNEGAKTVTVDVTELYVG